MDSHAPLRSATVKRGWDILSGPTVFDKHCTDTTTSFTVRTRGSGETEHIQVSILGVGEALDPDDLREFTGSFFQRDEFIRVLGAFSPREQRGFLHQE